jgi:hypothetical protein
MALAQILAATAAALGMAAGPAPAPTPTPAPTPAVATIELLVGDSTAYAAGPELLAIADPDPVMYTEPGAWMPTWENHINFHTTFPPLAREVIIVLGTNDALHPTFSPTVWDRVFDNMATKGVCVVVVDHRMTRPTDFAFDANMAAVYAEHPEVQRLPWRTTADQHPEWHLSDGIHHNQTGQWNFAYALWLALQVCP